MNSAKKFQVPVFIDESWKEVIFPWSRQNFVPFVRVICLKTRHTVELSMGRLWGEGGFKESFNMLTPSGFGQMISAAREFTGSFAACRFTSTFCEIINVSPSLSGTLAERLSQIAGNESESGDLEKLKKTRLFEAALVDFCGHPLSVQKKEKPKRKRLDWNDERIEDWPSEKNDPANWWKK
jgi:hypothetical protein